MDSTAIAANVTLLAHGGQMTADEIAIVGGGVGLAVLFPAAVLFFIIRKSNRHADSYASDGNAGPSFAPSAPVGSAMSDGVVGFPANNVDR